MVRYCSSLLSHLNNARAAHLAERRPVTVACLDPAHDRRPAATAHDERRSAPAQSHRLVLVVAKLHGGESSSRCEEEAEKEEALVGISDDSQDAKVEVRVPKTVDDFHQVALESFKVGRRFLSF